MGKGRGEEGGETQHCGHEATTRDQCIYCGAVTAKVCAVHGPNDRSGCWEIVDRYTHAPGCRLVAAYTGKPVYVPEPETQVRTEMVFHPHVDLPKAPFVTEEGIRNHFEKRGFTVSVEDDEVVIAKGDACERFPRGVLGDAGVFLLLAIHWLKERGHARVGRPTTAA